MSVQLAAFFLPGRSALLLALLALDGLCSCAPEATTCDEGVIQNYAVNF